MNNSKVWHTRMGHIGNNQLAKIVDLLCVKVNSDATEILALVVNRLEYLITKLNLKLVDPLRGSRVM
jgi:hypothetical protein